MVFQPSREFYEKIAPPNSFIHSEDFNNDVQKLSAYLNLISNEFNLYVKHLEWKFNYDIIYTGQMVEKRRICELCYELNKEKSIIYYESISKWFNKGCIN